MKLTDHELKGCSPIPLAHYLKALGILRLVAEQKDPKARGYWKDDVFHLVTTNDEVSTKEGLEKFFLEEYQPTPVVDPWNGGSGFWPKDNLSGISPISQSSHPRFRNYRAAIELVQEELATPKHNKIKEAKNLPEGKRPFISFLREKFDEAALNWLDAALVIGSEKSSFPALLGTGGNDGRLDFTNNFMQRISCNLFDMTTGHPTADAVALITPSLYSDKTTKGDPNLAMGQFMPAATNINAWDFVLMIEGTLVFQVSPVRKLDGENLVQAAAPFAIQSRPGGYASASDEDSGNHRGEQWMPLWEKPSLFSEIKSLFGEGRIRQEYGIARHPIDAALAVHSLGANRGVCAFIRYGFIERNGQANLAVPLDRIPADAAPELKPLREISDWIERFQRKLDNESAFTNRLSRNIRDAMMDVCRDGKCPEKWQTLLVRLSEAEDLIIRSKTLFDNFCALPTLSRDWAYRAAEPTPEFRLALSLASQNDLEGGAQSRNIGSIRLHCVPVANNYGKLDDTRKHRLTWNSSAPLETNLIALTRRRIQESDAKGLSHPALQCLYPALMEDVEKFIEGQIDMRRVQALARGLMAIRLDKYDARLLALTRGNDGKTTSGPHVHPSPLHALFRLSMLRNAFTGDTGEDIPCSPAVYNLLAGGQMESAGRRAAQHLSAHGMRPQLREVFGNRQNAHRLAAALAFPLSPGCYPELKNAVLKTFMDTE